MPKKKKAAAKKKKRQPAQQPQQPQEFEVQDIRGRRVRKGKVEYRVLWSGYSESEATWEPEANLLPELEDEIAAYNRRGARKGGGDAAGAAAGGDGGEGESSEGSEEEAAAREEPRRASKRARRPVERHPGIVDPLHKMPRRVPAKQEAEPASSEEEEPAASRPAKPEAAAAAAPAAAGAAKPEAAGGKKRKLASPRGDDGAEQPSPKKAPKRELTREEKAAAALARGEAYLGAKFSLSDQRVPPAARPAAPAAPDAGLSSSPAALPVPALPTARERGPRRARSAAAFALAERISAPQWDGAGGSSVDWHAADAERYVAALASEIAEEERELGFQRSAPTDCFRLRFCLDHLFKKTAGANRFHKGETVGCGNCQRQIQAPVRCFFLVCPLCRKKNACSGVVSNPVGKSEAVGVAVTAPAAAGAAAAPAGGGGGGGAGAVIDLSADDEDSAPKPVLGAPAAAASPQLLAAPPAGGTAPPQLLSAPSAPKLLSAPPQVLSAPRSAPSAASAAAPQQEVVDLSGGDSNDGASAQPVQRPNPRRLDSAPAPGPRPPARPPPRRQQHAAPAPVAAGPAAAAGKARGVEDAKARAAAALAAAMAREGDGA